MLTARKSEVDRVLGLEMGADDYVTKPFSLRELLARIRANLRRISYDREEPQDAIYVHDSLRIDVAARRAELAGIPLSLQPKEFDLLLYFVQHPGMVLTRARLLGSVWGHEFVGERTVDVHVRRLRAKLEFGDADGLIRTIHGVGYAFGGDEVAAAGSRSASSPGGVEK
jgi:DNA-binding response OmpR family regulator